jgi:hypothetical protein
MVAHISSCAVNRLHIAYHCSLEPTQAICQCPCGNRINEVVLICSSCTHAVPVLLGVASGEDKEMAVGVETSTQNGSVDLVQMDSCDRTSGPRLSERVSMIDTDSTILGSHLARFSRIGHAVSMYEVHPNFNKKTLKANVPKVIAFDERVSLQGKLTSIS